mmetsp:Transcript_59039/g.109103  ORF Transcript_59039/g.109103 Transcript_59039/m.109103 type:complete len:231 (-) Transcript_59039:380-1072(-)
MQQGPVAVMPQGSHVAAFPQAFVVMPQWATTMPAPQWCGGAATAAPVFTSCSPAAPQEQHQPCKASKDLSLLGGVFGIAGVSQLPAASTAGKDKLRKNKGRAVKFPQERQAQRPSTARRPCGADWRAHVEEQEEPVHMWAAAEESAESKVEVREQSPDLECSPGKQSPICVTGQARADEKRRRWADIADDDDDCEDALSSHPSESTRGTWSFSDTASTHGSDVDCSDDDA